MSTLRLNYDSYVDLGRMENPLGESNGFFDTVASHPDTEPPTLSDIKESHNLFCHGVTAPAVTGIVQFAGSHTRIMETLMGKSGPTVVGWRYVTPIVPDISYTNASPYKNDFIKSAIRTGHLEMDVDDISGVGVSGGAALNVIANPSVPTGHLYTWEEIAEFITTVPPNGIVIIDETYLPFCGENWIDLSVRAHMDSTEIINAKNDNVKIVITCDWTKMFPSGGKCFASSATILNDSWATIIQLTQSKWPIGDISMKYLKHCFDDLVYTQQTHLLLPTWRSLMVAQLEQIVPLWTVRGHECMPWVWMRADNDDAVGRVYGKLLTKGITILQGRRVGGDVRSMSIMVKEGSALADFYLTFSRYAIEMPLGQEFTSFRSMIANLFNDVETISVNRSFIMPHKHYSIVSYGRHLATYQPHVPLENTVNTLIDLSADTDNPIVPIVATRIYIGTDVRWVIIDGHSRFEVMTALFPNNNVLIPIYTVDYMSPLIFANTMERLPYTSHNPNERNMDEKNVVLSTVSAGNKLPVTRNSHQVLCAGQLFPIHIITTTFAPMGGTDVVETEAEAPAT